MDFNTVEAELREIDEDFTCGRMNAFGTQTTQDEIGKELRKVSELELQIFFRAASQIKTSCEEESTVQRILAQRTGLPPEATPQAAAPPSTSNAGTEEKPPNQAADEGEEARAEKVESSPPPPPSATGAASPTRNQLPQRNPLRPHSTKSQRCSERVKLH